MLKHLLRYILLTSFVTIAFVRCATVGAPTGGPIDSLPPVLVGSHPLPYTTNFKGKKVILAFNEYIQLKEQSKLFFVSPPPTQKPYLTIKGKSVVVEFQEPLDSNATYRLDFGGSLVDNNEGNAYDGLNFVFSTGPTIDSLVMAGQTIDAFTRDTVIGAFLFYFYAKADSLKRDSTMYKARAEALFRSDSSGYFIADILKDKPYRLYAMADENGNQLYESGTDMIGFLDSTYNPVDLPEFMLAFDSVRRRWDVTPPQVMFELFKEEPVKRQTLLEHKRPAKQQLQLVFNAPKTQVDTLRFDSVPDSWLRKHWNHKGDSLSIWIAPPSKELLKALPDTLTARLAFQKQDSLFQFFSNGQNLSFNFKAAKQEVKVKKEPTVEKPKKVRKNKKRKKQRPLKDSSTTTVVAKDSVAKKKEYNPFTVKVNASNEIVPGDITFDFAVPLVSVDKERIILTHFPTIVKKGRAQASSDTKAAGKPIAFEFVQDTTLLTKWKLKAPFKAGDNYELLIPDQTFKDIAFQTNDTMKAAFAVSLPEKFGMLDLKIKTDSLDQAQYLLQIIKGAKTGLTIERTIIYNPAVSKNIPKVTYLATGNYRLRIVRDENHNGIWDTGDLVTRTPPEKVRLWRSTAGATEIISKTNWEIPLTINIPELFAKP